MAHIIDVPKGGAKILTKPSSKLFSSLPFRAESRGGGEVGEEGSRDGERDGGRGGSK